MLSIVKSFKLDNCSDQPLSHLLETKRQKMGLTAMAVAAAVIPS